MTQDGVIVISAQRFRSQPRNREDAQARLFEMIREAAVAPVRRRATRPTLGSKERRLDGKGVRSTIKSNRRKPQEE
jgi:ribosome-associated protein